MTAGPALSAAGLDVKFDGVPALSDVTLEVPSGASVAVLGPNGAGKSTLFEAAIGLVAPSRGSIELHSRRVAFVPQHLDVDQTFPVTVGDVVSMGRYGDLGYLRRPGPRDRELVAEALDALGIEALERRRFGSLSGGERQRALLAQAVAQDAEIVLLDEPLTGVDVPTQESIRALLGRWHAAGRTVIVATHDLASATRDYDLVMCLNRRLISFGPPDVACTEDVLRETFAGRIVRVGSLMVDVSEHHEVH
ncbi:MAG: zinc ABC transporter ATP-binding protein AztA [Solirubrobacterales bacterium]